ncbi:hypothetical protein [Singulisphaera sp. PoT]|uniref:hypothetical protein n=1 Tax=Singulisphaera sp. PoT TaxID=3411797 RepID=UPI003BF4AFC9
MNFRREIVKKSTKIMQEDSSPHRRYVAAENDRAKPVQSVTYAARHAGHLGISANKAPGTSHARHSRSLRSPDDFLRSLAASQHVLIAASPA